MNKILKVPYDSLMRAGAAEFMILYRTYTNVAEKMAEERKKEEEENKRIKAQEEKMVRKQQPPPNKNKNNNNGFTYEMFNNPMAAIGLDNISDDELEELLGG